MLSELGDAFEEAVDRLTQVRVYCILLNYLQPLYLELVGIGTNIIVWFVLLSEG
jgi:hypothetical protein